MLYMAIVNRKYMVPVNASSARDAGARIESVVTHGLDEVSVFDPVHESAKFQWAYDTCESISLNDMTIAANRYHAWLLRNYNEMLMRENSLEQEVYDLENRLRTAMDNLRNEQYKAEAYRKQNGLPHGMTPMNEILELEKLF